MIEGCTEHGLIGETQVRLHRILHSLVMLGSIVFTCLVNMIFLAPGNRTMLTEPGNSCLLWVDWMGDWVHFNCGILQ